MSYKILIVFLVVLFVFISITIPSRAGSLDEKINRLDELTKSLYNQAKLQDYEQAKLIIEEISVLIPSVQYKGLTTVEGIEAISSSIIETKRNLAAIQPNNEKIIYSSTKLFLAVDALTHRGQPLWQRYYNVLQTDIEALKKANYLDDLPNAELNLQNLQIHYNLLKPALLVSRQPYQVEKIDSLLTALVSQNVKQNKDIILNQLTENIHSLFYGKDQDAFGNIMGMQILVKTAIGMGLIIFLVLSYVIWRKFKARYTVI